jgi:hypothetical protein
MLDKYFKIIFLPFWLSGGKVVEVDKSGNSDEVVTSGKSDVVVTSGKTVDVV